jgi:hypothetical protein
MLARESIAGLAHACMCGGVARLLGALQRERGVAERRSGTEASTPGCALRVRQPWDQLSCEKSRAHNSLPNPATLSNYVTATAHVSIGSTASMEPHWASKRRSS